MTIDPVVKFCSECSEPIKCFGMSSGNNFGASYWTDGAEPSSMTIGDCPLALCPHCKAVIWRDNLAMEYYNWENPNKDINNKYLNMKFFPWYPPKDYVRILLKCGLNKHEEKAIREYLWRDYNNSKKAKTVTVPLSKSEESNLIALSKIIDEDTQKDILMKAEIFRELSDFSTASILLNKVTDKELLRYKTVIHNLVENKNPFLAKIQ